MGREQLRLPSIGITAYSDFYTTPDPKVWGDYWLKKNLAKEFIRMNWPVVESAPRIRLHLFGEPAANITSDTYNILWIHSHPDWITRDTLSKYQKIFCISEPFIGKIKAMGFDAEFLMLPTGFTPLKREKKYDLVFVGNTKQGSKRKIIRDIGSPRYSLKIWGWGWKGIIPDEWYGGEYYENERLNELYASSKIVLNDHHDDMGREGFINPRILDVLASGGFVISDRVKGIGELLENSVPVYDSPEELRGLVEKHMNDSSAREHLAGKGQEIARRYSFKSACSAIIRHIESVSATLCL